jgi:hypothetical protein
MVPREAECGEASLPAASLERILLGVIIGPLCHMLLELRALFDTMLPKTSHTNFFYPHFHM